MYLNQWRPFEPLLIAVILNLTTTHYYSILIEFVPRKVCMIIDVSMICHTHISASSIPTMRNKTESKSVYSLALYFCHSSLFTCLSRQRPEKLMLNRQLPLVVVCWYLENLSCQLTPVLLPARWSSSFGVPSLDRVLRQTTVAYRTPSRLHLFTLLIVSSYCEYVVSRTLCLSIFLDHWDYYCTTYKSLPSIAANVRLLFFIVFQVHVLILLVN